MVAAPDRPGDRCPLGQSPGRPSTELCENRCAADSHTRVVPYPEPKIAHTVQYCNNNDDGHHVPSRSALPPLLTTRATAPRTLSRHDDDKPACCDDGGMPSEERSPAITSAKYTLPNCSRGIVVDGRRSRRTTGNPSAPNKSEMATGAPGVPGFCTTSRRIRAFLSPGPSYRVLGNDDEG